MGYTHTPGGLLCCDYCGDTDGTRKRSCPFGYCLQVAACSKCRKENRQHFGKAWHREQGCERLHLEFVARQQQRADLLQEGRAVRCSALSVREIQEGLVHVLFDKQAGGTVGYYMQTAVYHSFNLFENTTPEDYAKHGQLYEAPPTFEHGSPSKLVTPAEFAPFFAEMQSTVDAEAIRSALQERK